MTMDELRVHMYCHSKGKQQLPPTSTSTRSHILRSLFATYKMVSVLTPDSPDLDPTDFGYVIDDGLLVADPANRSISEKYTVRCNCSKCATVRCPCMQSEDMCCKFVLVLPTVTFVEIVNLPQMLPISYLM